MKSKKVELKTKWKECTDCHLVVNEKDEKIHQRSCSGTFSLSKAFSLPHGFMYDGTFYARVERKTKKMGKLSLPCNMGPAVIMHPSIMQFLSVLPEGYILLGNCKTSYVLQCWPSETVMPSKIALVPGHTFRDSFRGHVKVHNYCSVASNACLAVELHLSSDVYKDFMNSANFKKFILEKYGGCIVAPEMILSLKYQGFPCELKITDIFGPPIPNCMASSKSIDCTARAVKQDVSDEIIGDMNNLSIQENCSLACESDANSDCLHDVSIDPLLFHGQADFVCSTPLSRKDPERKPPMSRDCPEYEKPSLLKSQCTYFRVEPRTVIKLTKKPVLPTHRTADVTFSNVGGLHKQIRILKNLLRSFLSFHNGFLNEQKIPKGVLLHGPPGTGKSLMVKALCNEFNIPTLFIKADEVFSKFHVGSSLGNLRKLFSEAVEKAPSILVIEEIDVLCLKSSSQKFSSERKLIADELPTLIDELPKDNGRNVIVIATTSKLYLVDSALRRHGRLEKEVKFDIPTSAERKEILSKLLESRKHTLTSERIAEISFFAHGFTGRDLERLCVNAAMQAKLGTEEYSGLTFESMTEVLKTMKPSAMEEFIAEIPNVRWSDIGGMHDVKQEIIDMVDLPLRNPEAFQLSGISPSRGIIMYGPPGCSKTMVAKAVATESKINFISVKGPQLFNKWVGESEKAVRDLFRKARSSAPCIIFFDEIDSLAAERGRSSGGSNVGERVLTQLLVEIDGIDVMAGVSIIAATNRPDLIDPVFLRPGRFDRILYVPLPDAHTRKEIFQINLKKMPSADDVDIEKLVQATEGYTGAEIVAVCQEAAMLIISEDIVSTTSVVNMSHFEKALTIVTPRTSKDLIEFYETYSLKRV